MLLLRLPSMSRRWLVAVQLVVVAITIGDARADFSLLGVEFNGGSDCIAASIDHRPWDSDRLLRNSLA